MVGDQHIESLSGPQLRASNPDFEASQRQLAAKQKAFFFGSANPEPWHIPVSKTLNRTSLESAIVFKASRYAFMAASTADGISSMSLDDWSALSNYDLFGSIGVAHKSK